MLTVDQAQQAILEHVATGPQHSVPLDEALGQVLATHIDSDIDSPPFDKALMDGFAVRAQDVADGTARLNILEEVTAGSVAANSIGPGEAIQIMTGAPMPDGADAVVRIEDTQVETSHTQPVVSIQTRPVSPGQDWILQGTSMKRGDNVIPKGRALRPQELGLLAELGQHTVDVYRQVTVGVLATGDELVAIDQQPAAGQIRNSNESMLAAQVRASGAVARELGIARDNREHLAEKIQQGLDCDVLLLSGGVSAGRLDLVPDQLQAAGITRVFHKVQVKPGKPLWFGTSNNTVVFGLPGNPVSSMVCFELFVRTALRRLTGLSPATPDPAFARLDCDFKFDSDRPTYFPARLESHPEGPTITPINWHGSSDLRSTTHANSMIHFPAGKQLYQANQWVEVHLWAGQA